MILIPLGAKSTTSYSISRSARRRVWSRSDTQFVMWPWSESRSDSRLRWHSSSLSRFAYKY